MNEHEKKLRELIARTDTPASLTAYLDALLVGHRAEVEETAAIRTEHLKSSGWMEPREAAILRQSLRFARDAALEEAATLIECGCGLEQCRQNLGPARIRALKASPAAMAPEVARLRDGLFALGFAAEYPSEAGSVVDCALAVAKGRVGAVSVEKVREALIALRDDGHMDLPYGQSARDAAYAAAKRLGVDLDAGPRS